ncbi:hypothetical protein WJX73_009592 [Symbiochloris irregularis]|uniref:Early meiotic induction protein 1 n=1 Tax=Symbiochloris irregularis TaxID=706552 RepID=A0AAW1PIU2_9CHLO
MTDFSTQDTPQPPKESCIPKIDALWFCYSPVHQFTQYYRFGTVDDCFGHWSRLWDCLKQRTKYADLVRGRKEPQHPLWKLRTKEQATEFWEKEFGHLDKPGKAPPRKSEFSLNTEL